MPANKLVTIGPVALSNTLTTNIVNPPTLTGGVNPPPNSTNTYLVLTHIRIVNKTAGAVTFTLYLGATGGNVAGTEFIGTALSVAANSAFDWYGRARIDVSQFIVGGASAATSLTFEAEGEIGVN
jgi:hypothetical protein